MNRYSNFPNIWWWVYLMLAACFFLKKHALKGQVTKFSLGKRLLVY